MAISVIKKSFIRNNFIKATYKKPFIVCKLVSMAVAKLSLVLVWPAADKGGPGVLLSKGLKGSA